MKCSKCGGEYEVQPDGSLKCKDCDNWVIDFRTSHLDTTPQLPFDERRCRICGVPRKRCCC